jgi:hypothetical protein
MRFGRKNDAYKLCEQLWNALRKSGRVAQGRPSVRQWSYDADNGSIIYNSRNDVYALIVTISRLPGIGPAALCHKNIGLGVLRTHAEIGNGRHVADDAAEQQVREFIDLVFPGVLPA